MAFKSTEELEILSRKLLGISAEQFIKNYQRGEYTLTHEAADPAVKKVLDFFLKR